MAQQKDRILQKKFIFKFILIVNIKTKKNLFGYNNIKNTSENHIVFEVNSKYYTYLFSRQYRSQSKILIANKFNKKLRESLIIYLQNLLYSQKYQKKNI